MDEQTGTPSSMDEWMKQLQQFLNDPDRIQELSKIAAVIRQEIPDDLDEPSKASGSAEALLRELLPHLSRQAQIRLKRAEEIGSLAKIASEMKTTRQEDNGGDQNV